MKTNIIEIQPTIEVFNDNKKEVIKNCELLLNASFFERLNFIFKKETKFNFRIKINLDRNIVVRSINYVGYAGVKGVWKASARK